MKKSPLKRIRLFPLENKQVDEVIRDAGYAYENKTIPG
jgi:hypothetical protein